LFGVKLQAVFTTILLVVSMAACGGGTGKTASNLSSPSPIPSGGVIWQRVNVPAAATQVNYIAFNSSNHWFIADRNQGFYRSTDEGTTWAKINTGLTTTLGWTINVIPPTATLSRAHTVELPSMLTP